MASGACAAIINPVVAPRYHGATANADNPSTAKKMKLFFRRLASRENLYALLLCLLLIALLIVTADQAPQWIYQGF